MGFRAIPVQIGVGDTDVFELPPTLAGAVVLAIGNIDAAARSYTFKFYDASQGTTTTIASDVNLSGNTISKFPIPIAMQAGDKIVMAASEADSVTAFATVTDSAATPAAVGLNPRGTWSSVATYQTNDIVYKLGILYVSLQDANTNQDPVTGTAYWMVAFDPADLTLGALALGDNAGDVPFTPTGDIAADNVAGALSELDGEKLAAAAAAAVYSPITRTNRDISGTTDTLVLADAGKLVTTSNASATTITVPPNSSVAFPVGTQIDVIQEGAGQVTFAQGAGVTINSDTSKKKITVRYGGATLIKRATDTWSLVGNLAA